MNTVMRYQFSDDEQHLIEHHLTQHHGFLSCGNLDQLNVMKMCEFHHYKKGYMFIKLCDKGLYPISTTVLKRWLAFKDMKIEKSVFEHAFIIIKETDVPLLPIISTLDYLNSTKEEVKVAIDGYAASGKTTLSSLLASLFDGNVFHMDDFFQKPSSYDNQGVSQYGRNINFEKINETVIRPISKRSSVIYHPFDVVTHTHLAPIKVAYRKFMIFEGAFSMHPSMKLTYDYKIFYHISRYEQIKRIYRRNGLKKLIKFLDTWIPSERTYVKNLGIRDQADRILDRKTTQNT